MLLLHRARRPLSGEWAYILFAFDIKLPVNAKLLEWKHAHTRSEPPSLVYHYFHRLTEHLQISIPSEFGEDEDHGRSVKMII